MLTSIAVTEMSVPSFSHPSGTLDPAIAKLTAAEAAFAALGYAIQKGELQIVREMLEGDEFNHQLLKTADYAGNTALVSDIRRTASFWCRSSWVIIYFLAFFIPLEEDKAAKKESRF